MNERVLVATDGLAPLRGAVRVAAELARQRGARVDVIGVVEPVAQSVGVPSATLRHASAVDRMRAVELDAEVRAALAAAPAVARDWPIEILRGPVRSTIAEAALRREADLILLGRRERSPGRNRGPSLAMELVGLAAVPVLVAEPMLEHLPRRAIAAVDFSASSLRAARVGAALADGGGRLELVHVIPPLDFPAALLWGWNDSSARRAEEEFTGFRARLDAPDDLEVVTALARNDPAEELLARIRAADAELITAGDHGYLCRGHVLLGGVATRLLTEASCSVLIAPAPDRVPLLGIVPAASAHARAPAAPVTPPTAAAATTADAAST